MKYARSLRAICASLLLAGFASAYASDIQPLDVPASQAVHQTQGIYTITGEDKSTQAVVKGPYVFAMGKDTLGLKTIHDSKPIQFVDACERAGFSGPTSASIQTGTTVSLSAAPAFAHALAGATQQPVNYDIQTIELTNMGTHFGHDCVTQSPWVKTSNQRGSVALTRGVKVLLVDSVETNTQWFVQQAH